MARPCYVYLKLKMSGPYDPITVEGSRSMATECDQQHVKIADSTCAKEDLTTYKEKVDPADTTMLKKSTPDNNPSSNRLKTQRELTLSLVILPSSSSSGAGCLINRKARSSSFSVRIETSSHGNLLTCQVSRGTSLST